jgi:hypothetical protein
MKRHIRALGIALAVVGLLSGTVAAGHLQVGVKSYTGCLVSKDGVIIKIKEGEAPTSPCSGGMVQVHFGGGDITSISVTGALTGGGDNGAVTIGLKPEFTLPTGCESGEIAEWNGTAWDCGIDNDTTYSPGVGLDQEGTTFHIAPSYRVKNTPDCSTGQFATGFDSSGTIQCAAPAAGTNAGFFSRTSGPVSVAGTTTILSETLPAGNYLLFAHINANNPTFNNDEHAEGRCQIPGDTASLTIPDDFDLDTTVANTNLALVGAVVHGGGAVALTCTEVTGNFDVESATLSAIKVDSLG